MERLFFLTTATRALPGWVRYGITTALVAAALATRFLLFGPGAGRPFLAFYPVVVIAGSVFDRGTSLYATTMAALLGTWFFVPPVRSLDIAAAADMAELLLFLISAVLIAFLLEAMHGALAEMADDRQRAKAANAELAEANRQLATLATGRETLLRECIHRSRNDLQRLIAMLQFQVGAARESPAVREALAEAMSRIQALSRVNQRLEAHWHQPGTVLDSRHFLEGLGEDLREAAFGLRPVALEVRAESHPLSVVRAVPVGLVVNELVTNALKYAFPEDRHGIVRIGFRREGGEFVLTVEDDGIGHDGQGPAHGTGLGARLARALAAQLGGRISLGPGCGSAGEGPGTGWTLRFPVEG
jgi:two-component sensor histidine kinase